MTQQEYTAASGAVEGGGSPDSEGSGSSRRGGDSASDEERARRARTERMTVDPNGGGTYEVAGESGRSYLVDVEAGRCTCPDYTYRRVRCKHLRRVAIEINEGRVPPPGHVAVACAVCGTDLFVERDAATPYLCADHEFEPGDFAYDRNTGDRVLIVALTDRRADEVSIDGPADRTVADHYSNAAYEPDAPVVGAVYPQSIRFTEHGPVPDALTVYSFPRPRLSKTPVEGDRSRQQRLDGRLAH